MPLGSRGVPRLGPGRGEDFEPGLRVAGEVRAALLERCGNVLLPETGGDGGGFGALICQLISIDFYHRFSFSKLQNDIMGC